ncbi:uncharacterized protein HMPREF1541_01620 [Cyphellophora europaea CBS 101466]|uniref:N-acetyltransferase domain-containing protein n=1 Tax=Cyphellophora europaea (strain CBS 101466) TaxID=1220924 RepID=W2S3F4_CYPE1|nr:uncharacterized protein HMPREF1541_01620 [Cyphellophora europaea CBS 101466]ETN42464.1 hypothetical protein HMPREF1541_01620 [Cyphellophora europaea CBS 101466]
MVTTGSSKSSSIVSETPPSADTVEKFISLLSQSFGKVPLTTAFITEIDGVKADTSPSALTPDRLHKHFSLGIPAAAKANILLLHDADFKAAALIEPPDFCGIPPGQARRDPGPVLSEWRSTARLLKSKYLALPDSGPRSWDTPAAPSQSSGGPAEDPYPANFNKDAAVEVRPCYHIAIVAKDPSLSAAQQETASKAILEHVLDKAKQEAVPAWAEASLPDKKQEYERVGFRVVEEVVVGKGKVNEAGWPSNGGAGVKCWGLIYDQHLQ